MSKPDNFWKWFSSNSERILNFENAQEKVFNDIMAQLSKFHPDLTFEISSWLGDTREFVISADGIKEAFPFVTQLASAAPSLPNWTIRAFRPRIEVQFEIEVGAIKLDPKEIWFSSASVDGKVDLTIYYPHYTEETEQEFLRATFILLDAALGEYDTEMKLGFVEIDVLPKNPAALGFLPFKELPQTVDGLSIGRAN